MAKPLDPSFADRCIVSCGIVSTELTQLVEACFLNPLQILSTPPGCRVPEDHREHLRSSAHNLFLRKGRRGCEGGCTPQHITAHAEQDATDADLCPDCGAEVHKRQRTCIAGHGT